MIQTVHVADVGDVPEGGCILVEVAGRKVALFNIAGKYHAIDDLCPHEDGSLSEGEVEGNVVTCPFHDATFDVTSGAVLSPPAETGVKSYKVSVDGGAITIEVP
ncbi:MAG: non-heme iron oxygenase ferredoxin subunit [Planctomycetes bacterium]|nr:non-heme iron oxygenase ferredoxin subunit [Planctomycetota bacterium]MCH8966773.1 non-heme iron oxygenase ferredoxin subunit [Planctomycetota bacterium]